MAEYHIPRFRREPSNFENSAKVKRIAAWALEKKCGFILADPFPNPRIREDTLTYQHKGKMIALYRAVNDDSHFLFATSDKASSNAIDHLLRLEEGKHLQVFFFNWEIDSLAITTGANRAKEGKNGGPLIYPDAIVSRVYDFLSRHASLIIAGTRPAVDCALESFTKILLRRGWVDKKPLEIEEFLVFRRE